MKTKRELTTLEKGILVAILISIVTLLLRVWNPSFLEWFHITSMQDDNFLMNIIQTIWVVVHVITYLITGLSVIILLIFAIIGISIFALTFIPFIIDIMISLWNLVSRLIPHMKYIEPCAVEWYLNFTSGFLSEKMEDIVGTLLTMSVIGGFIILFLHVMSIVILQI